MSFAAFPFWLKCADLLVHLALGFAAGQLYFRSVWHSAQLFADRPGMAMALTVLRFGLLAGALFLAAREGAAPLLAAALGLMLARPLVLRSAG